jgi:DNA polymerase-3 subunit alpha
MNNFTNQFQNYNLQFHGVRLPTIDTGTDNYKYLVKLCNLGFEEKLKNGQIRQNDLSKYTERYDYELKVLKDNGLIDYVLLIHDVLSWCDKNNIPRGISRGSASGCLVFFLIGCNHICPIKHGLPFTRFISEARLQSKMVDGITYLNGKSLPDYDADCSYIHRDKILQYIENKYPGKTSKILTVSTLTGKILIKDCCKVILEYSEEEAKVVSEMVERLFGKVQTLDKTYQESKDFKEWVDSSPENKECFRVANCLENMIRGKGQHASGVAICYEQITNLIPLELSSSKDIISGYHMDDIATLMVKLDILGLKNVDVNYETCKLANVDIRSIDINHESIYKFLCNSSDYYGLFQISDGLTKKTCIDVKPKNIDQLAIILSLSRPGSYKDIPKYLNYIHNGVLESIYPDIDRCLSLTGNVILFQEQINQVCIEVYGFDEVLADQVRYCIGKKKKDDIKKFESIIFEKGKDRNVPEAVTKQVWETINNSADYLFSKNHAYAYAYTTAINCFLKANYPREFFLSVLNLAKSEPNPLEEIQKVQNELKNFGIKLLGPDIIKSDIQFKLEGNNEIRYALDSIKNISEKTIEKLKDFRHEYNNKFEIMLAAKEAGLNIGALSSICQSGCLDSYLTGTTRSKMVYEICVFNLLTPREKKRVTEIAPQFNYNLFPIIHHLKTLRDEKGKPFFKESRLETIRNRKIKYKEIYEKNSEYEKLTNFWYERYNLGFAYSDSLSNIMRYYYPEIIDLTEATTALPEEKLTVCGVVNEAKYWKSREKKTNCCKINISDSTGTTDVLCFNESIDQNNLQNGGQFEEGQIVMVRGKKQNDSIFASTISNQNINIYMKLSDLKPEKVEKILDKPENKE